MIKVLIFGIAGFVGKYLLDELIQTDVRYNIYGADILENYRLDGLLQYFQCNILEETTVVDIIDHVQPDYIVNLAALSSVGASWTMPKKTMEINLIGSLNIIEASLRLKLVPKILLIGSSEEYSVSEMPLNENSTLSANNPYGISKMALEQMAQIYCDKFGCNIYFTRSFNHTGIGQKETFVIPSFCKQAATIQRSGMAGSMKVGNLSAKRDISDVRDVVRAYRLILESGSRQRIFNVGSGNAYVIQDILEYIISLCDYPIKVEVDVERVRPVDNPYICCNNTLLRDETGWQPQFEIFDTVRELFHFYVEK